MDDISLHRPTALKNSSSSHRGSVISRGLLQMCSEVTVTVTAVPEPELAPTSYADLGFLAAHHTSVETAG